MDPTRQVTPEQEAQIAQILNLPPGSKLTMERFDSTQEARGKGSSISTSADEVAAKHKAESPTASLPGGIGASGGGSDTNTEGKGIPFPYVSLMFGVAALAALGFAGWSAYRGSMRGAVVAGVIALFCTGAAVVPQFAGPIVLIAALVAVGFYVWSEIQNRQHVEAARAAGEAITSPQLSEEARRQVLAAFHQAADQADIATLNKLNHRDGLPSLNPPLPKV